MKTFLLVTGFPEGIRVSTKSFLFRFKKKTGQAAEEIVLGLDNVYKGIQWSIERGPIFGIEELAFSSDMGRANTKQLFLYTNALSPTNENSLLTEQNVSVHAIEVLTTGGESKYSGFLFLFIYNYCHLFITFMYSMGPSSRPGPVLGHFVFNAFFHATIELKEKIISFKR